MVDILTLALTHALMAIALWRLLWRDDLDNDQGNATSPRRPWLSKRTEAGDEPA